jgi:annexin A7/11
MQQQVFNPLTDAQMIMQSLSKPKNLNTLIQIVTHRSNEQRQQIMQEYYHQYQINLHEEFLNNLSGNFKETIISLFYTPTDYDCYQIYKAVDGLGTNEETLIEIISSRTNEELNKIKQRYPQMYQRDLVELIKSETSGHLQKILITLLQADRPCNIIPNEQVCAESAKRLYDSQNGKKDNLYNSFVYVFTQKSREELALICKIYYNIYKRTLLEVVESSFSGNGRRVLKAIIYSLLSPSEYFAYRINKALKGFITNDNTLIRILVSRDEIDSDRIKRYYYQLYGITLYEHVNQKTSGDYKNLLLSLIGD